ncbi:D-alanyl-D-alanine carboxypeptidase family protein [Aerococcaceae bacterium WGS1372]
MKQMGRMILVVMALLITIPLQSVSALTLVDESMIQPLYKEATVEEMMKNLPESASLDDPYLMIINRENRITEDIPMEFAMTGSGEYYNAEIVEPFSAMISAAELEGYSYQTVSAYRTMAYQAANFDNRYMMYINDGYSEADAFYYTDMFVAPADATEHSTGLAFDLLGYDYQEYGRDLHQVYGQYGSAIWLADNAHNYGFVVRYLDGKQEITGYEYEPWHIRYVGVDHATFMHEYGLSLEEYLTLIHLRDQGAE